MNEAEDDVALKLLHTADWHLGHLVPSSEDGDARSFRTARGCDDTT